MVTSLSIEPLTGCPSRIRDNPILEVIDPFMSCDIFAETTKGQPGSNPSIGGAHGSIVGLGSSPGRRQEMSIFEPVVRGATERSSRATTRQPKAGPMPGPPVSGMRAWWGWSPEFTSMVDRFPFVTKFTSSSCLRLVLSHAPHPNRANRTSLLNPREVRCWACSVPRTCPTCA